MSRRFNGTSDYLEHGAAVVGAVPITMACWYKVVRYPPAGENHSLIAIGASAAVTRVQLILLGAAVRAQTVDVAGTATSAQLTSAKHGVGQWQHLCGVFASATDRRLFAYGQRVTSTTSKVLGTLTTTTLGTNYDTSVRENFARGLLAEAAIWNVALDDVEVNLLARGYYPDQIRPGSLKAYWPLVGQYSPNEIDRKGRFDATVFGAKPAIADQPPMIPRNRRSRALDFAALPPVAVDMVPVSRRSYQHRRTF